MSDILNIGLDAGSTTIKVVLTDSSKNIVYKTYGRHYADVLGSLINIFDEIIAKFGNIKVRMAITGSAGMGIAERSNLSFIQEVVASCELIEDMYPDTSVFVDIGGEDSKMIFFSKGKSPDMRMNGSCAGGTGSFIDQMASLLNVSIDEFNSLAENAKNTYPIASRCGVFSKTDVQNLLARNVCREDIAASVFKAVSMQVITALARGYKPKPKVFLCGGPLTFIPELRKAFINEINFSDSDVTISEHSEVIPAWGAAILAEEKSEVKTLKEFIDIIKNPVSNITAAKSNLRPLFESEAEFNDWKKSKEKYKIPTIEISNLKTDNCYIGVDSGSTTTKIVAIDEDDNVFFKYYSKNKGTSLNTFTEGLNLLMLEAKKHNKDLNVIGNCATGYGEDLIKTAYQLDHGMVETIAHYLAACHFQKDVSFILDIGGQDMKATFIQNEIIKRLEINEACSSGCGSFIETFANSLNYDVKSFSEIALQSKSPCDLGTRCTVFMNSKVKQSQREGADVADISAGLGYSVIKNCLNKVLKIKDKKELGDHIMVQGGTFRNLSVIRALEIELNKEVMVTDQPEHMGAYGAALYAKKMHQSGKNTERKLSQFVKPIIKSEKKLNCKGCENNCLVTQFVFENGNKYYSGNKCEKIFTNQGERQKKGINMHAEKYDLLFNREVKTSGKINLGMFRGLGIYENYPFWNSFFNSFDINIVLSDKSTMELYEKGIATVMADNICFPAKLVHGHVYDLIEKKVDRIFFPYVVYEKKEDESTNNSYNCPIVTGYSDVIISSIDPEKNYNIPVDAPTFNFDDKNLMKKSCKQYLKQILPDVDLKNFNAAFDKAIAEQERYEQTLCERANEIYNKAVEENRIVILLAARPYHIDPLIQHKISDLISDFGVDVITEDIVRNLETDAKKVQSVMQWAYTNRIFKSALWVANEKSNFVHYVQITSFGCGPDAFILDEVNDILRRGGKNATVIKVDDINNVGSVKLRFRSLIESLRFKNTSEIKPKKIQIQTPPFTKKDRQRTILAPWFGDFYSPFIPSAFEMMGYKLENLPPSDINTVKYGLRYSNSEICYPATLVVGDLIKALDTGKYKRDEIALGITQTGGQCRATNYVALIKKAMIASGHGDIPIVTVSFTAGLNEQPGFKINWLKGIKSILTCLVYADCLSQFYYSTVPRETVKGASEKIKNKYIKIGADALKDNNDKIFYKLVVDAKNEFAAVNSFADIPRIGVVGEIYVKYNNFGHKNVVNWLMEQGVEPVLPPIVKFFISSFANKEARIEGNVMNRQIPKFASDFALKLIYKVIHKMEKNLHDYPYYVPITNIHDDAKMASDIINLNAQFGEGWQIPAEFAEFAHNDINNVVSLQPFGCIANHVISKGIEKRTKEVYPNMNLLFLDFDSGMSEANIFNRLHFMIKNAQKEMHCQYS